MKITIKAAFMGMILLALGMSIPSKAYTAQCRGCWAYCFNPLPIGQAKDCSYCNVLCDASNISCSRAYR